LELRTVNANRKILNEGPEVWLHFPFPSNELLHPACA
jgi:hypothetical protein